MARFEDELKEALARREPSPNFTARVLAKANTPEPITSLGWLGWFDRSWAFRVAPIMAALLLIGGATLYREHQRAVEGEAAKEKLLVAIRIAGSKLQRTQHQIMKIQFGRVD